MRRSHTRRLGFGRRFQFPTSGLSAGLLARLRPPVSHSGFRVSLLPRFPDARRFQFPVSASGSGLIPFPGRRLRDHLFGFGFTAPISVSCSGSGFIAPASTAGLTLRLRVPLPVSPVFLAPFRLLPPPRSLFCGRPIPAYSPLPALCPSSSRASTRKLTGRKPSLQESIAEAGFFIQPS